MRQVSFVAKRCISYCSVMAVVENKAHDSERVCDLKTLRATAMGAEEEARSWERVGYHLPMF